MKDTLVSDSSPNHKRSRDPEDEVYLDNFHSHKRYLSEIMASSLNGLTVGDSSLPENLIESPARSESMCYFRLTHSGSGIPEELLSQMFESNTGISEEGINLLVSRKLLRLMNGDVQYLREAGKSSFITTVELALAHKSHGQGGNARSLGSSF